MKINLKNGELISISKEFPMNVLEIQDTLDRPKIPDDKPIVEFSISEYDNMELPYTMCRREFSADIYRLNLFAERLGNLKYDEMTAFKSLLIANPECSFEDMLKMSYGLDSVMIYPCKDCCELGEAHKLIYNKNSTLEDYKKAEKLFLAESNNCLALYDLGRVYSTEKSGLKDNDKSFEFYKKALQGFIQIEPNTKKIKSYLQYQIGMMYFKGFGTSVDNQKATEYFEKSAEHGNQYAKRLLALEYISGKKFEQDIEKGIALLTECADGGDTFSCYKLGNLYLKGEIVMQDLDKAEKYLLSAEDNEFTQYALGKLYLQKEKYDIMKAISYFEKSADKNMWASYQLGRLYLFGTDGLEKDNEKAVQYLNLSAEQGNEYAQNILDNQEKFENEMLASTIFSLFVNLSRCIEDDYHKNFQSGRKMIDSKLRRMISQKKQSLGIKIEPSQSQEQHY